MKYKKIFSLTLALALLPAFAGCAGIGSPTARMGMVRNPDTGLQFGSAIGKNIVTDATLFKNRKMKIRIRNTSGDVNFDLEQFRDKIAAAYAANGYEPTTTDKDFGLLLDINVLYSGQIQTNMAQQYSFLGAAAGSIYGRRSKAHEGTAIGAVSGATLGSISGSFVTDDTYIIVAMATIAYIKGPRKSEGKTITFSRSIPGKIMDDKEMEDRRKSRKIKQIASTRVAVFAGGRNVRQSEISAEVRQRFVRIMSNII